MRKIATFVAAAGLLAGVLALAACGGDDSPAASPSGQASLGDVAFDQAFIDAMVPHHQEAIEMAEAAKAAGLSQAELIEIADAIIATQQAEIDQMLGWRADWYGSDEVDPDGAAALGMPMEQMGMQHDPEDLAAAEDVDRTFASMMIDHHEGAIDMAARALEEAEHDELRSLAEAIVEAQEREVEIMRPHAVGEHHG